MAVTALTTPYSTVTANPTGTLTLTESLTPQRIQRAGRWIATNTTLAKNPDGTISPAATMASLTFSGGGSTSLATMTDQGHSLSLAWPRRLPTPRLSGATATYPNVLPGVDLALTANLDGGFSEVLIVHTAKAAANPALRTLELAVRTRGVVLRGDAVGNLSATAQHGRVVFSSPASLMWDSTTPARSKPSSARTRPAGWSSSIAGPGESAHTAHVGTHVAGDHLTLRPAVSMLTNRTTRYPVFIDPTWTAHNVTGNEQDYAEIQEAYPGGPDLNSGNDVTDGLGVGDQDSPNDCPCGIERTYYQIGIPSVLSGADILDAKLEATVSFAAADGPNTDTVHVYQVCPLNSSTSWSHPPCQGAEEASASFTTSNNFPNTGVGFDVTNGMRGAVASKWSNWTVGLFNANESSDEDFVRFAKNPSFVITYDHAPNIPSNLSAASNGDSTGCATATPYPWMGITASSTPPSLTAKLSDPDGDITQASFQYWTDGSSTKATLTGANTSSGHTSSVSLPASFMSGLSQTTTTTIDWQADATDGELTSSWSPTCHFVYDPLTPDQPSVASTSFPQEADAGTPPPAGTTGSFSVSAGSGESVARFVYSMDETPAVTTTTSGGSLTCASNNDYTNSVAATNNAATIENVTVQAPGTHTLYVYSCDAAGNASTLEGYQFTVLDDPSTTYPSLSAAFDNTAISANSQPSQADADGAGNSLSATDLANAGWNPGTHLSIDGAPLTLPTYGNGAADNVLAANQTIQTSGTGNALVFLVAAVNGTTQSPDPATYNDSYGSELAAPATPSNTPSVETNCTLSNNVATDCVPASGTLTYADGSHQAYYLTVPDWVYGPTGPAVITLPGRNTSSGQASKPVSLYAFAVPLNHAAALASVTLPDISASVTNSTAIDTPGLHIFAMGIRDTTANAAPSGTTWTGSWSAPNEGAYNFEGANFDNQTFRTGVVPTTAGSAIRLRLSNALGTTPLQIGHITVATAISGSDLEPTSTPQTVTFGGSQTTTIPAGAETFTDPLTFSVTTTQAVLISIYLQNSVPYLVQHSWATQAYQYVSPIGAGDHTTDMTNTALTGTGSYNGYFTDMLTDLDVATTNTPTAAVLGDNLINPFNDNGLTTTPGSYSGRVPYELAADLQANTAGIPQYGILAEGIENNQIATDQNQGDPSALSRIDRDILDQPNIGTVIIDEGLTDILAGTNPQSIIDADAELINQLNAFGITAILTTLTPCDGYGGCSTTADQNRVIVNIWINDQAGSGVYSVDFNNAVATPDPNSTTTPPEQELNNAAAPNDDDTGDHVNLTNDGYANITNTIPLTDLTPYTPPSN